MVMTEEIKLDQQLNLSGEQATDVLAELLRFSAGAEYHKLARREEKQGHPFTAAIEWRKAAELFLEDESLAERCWREWERIMKLPRRLAGSL
jgi:hypothetical protein